MTFLPWVRIWILISAFASASGWLLSAVGELSPLGYAVAGLFSAACLYAGRHQLAGQFGCFASNRSRRRFRRFLPLAFVILAALVLLGGILYAPSNYDALTYRLPRVLHWLAEGRWHWIPTVNDRMNDRSCGFEWLMAPVLLFTHSDRLLFLINFVPFLLLPGLVFSVFTRLGVSGRVAWQWMWLLPTGYNFLLQAGSLANDAYAAVYALAALDFALRARSSRRFADVGFSTLAVALLTGAKSGDLPLVLPWLVVFTPVASKLLVRPLAGCFLIVAALLVSFLPTAGLNYVNCGDWTGLSLESPQIVMRHPLAGILGNSLVFISSNFVPTIFPLAGWWNQSVLSWLPAGFGSLLQSNFEPAFQKLGEVPTEEMSGLGFGLSCLLAVTVLASLRRRSRWTFRRTSWPLGMALVTPYISLLCFFAKSGMMTLARLVSAYYPLLLPLLLRGPAAAALVRRRWWHASVGAVLFLAFVAVVLTPARPLWPAQTILSELPASAAQSPVFRRAQAVYSNYADRPDPLARVRSLLPADCSVVGFVGGPNDTEISFWRPYGRHTVVHILATDTSAQIRAHGVQYAVVGEARLALDHETLDAWLQQHDAVVLASAMGTMTVNDSPKHWYVVRLGTPANGPNPAP